MRSQIIRSCGIFFFVVVLGMAASSALRSPALAEVPADPPIFSEPLEFENAFFPFEPGAVRVYAGKSTDGSLASLDTCLGETRDFEWGGGSVTCAILVETAFEGGRLVEISHNYFAEADDGSVYYFGEVVDLYEDGEIVAHDGSWLVGGPGPGDPLETAEVDDPALFMPGVPEVGDTWKPEDVPAGPQETAEVVRDGRRVRVPAGSFEACIVVEELDVADDETGWKYYAPGVGVVMDRSRGERLVLIAHSFPASD